MKFIIIVAIGEGREIGKDNKMLWHLPGEMQFFKKTTVGNTVLMGRKTWESLPEKFRPLPQRKNIVLSRNTDFHAEGAIVISNLEEITNVASNDETCFVIGGKQIFELFLNSQLINEMYISYVHEAFEDATIFFPDFDENNWKTETVLHCEKDEKNIYSFTVKKYIKL